MKIIKKKERLINYRKKDNLIRRLFLIDVPGEPLYPAGEVGLVLCKKKKIKIS